MTNTTAPIAPAVRAGDRERERTANQLGQALAQDYLVMEEYETRLQAAFAAHTTGELRQLVADLPLARLRRNDPQRVAARRKAARRGMQVGVVGGFVVGSTVGGGCFWRIWLILGAGIVLASHAIPVRFAGPPRLCHGAPAVDRR